MKTKITLFIFCYLIWIFLDWPLDVQHALSGVAAAIAVVFLTGSLFKQPMRSGPVRICLGLCRGIPLVAWEALKTNINFILRVFNPQVSVAASIVEVDITLKTHVGVTFLANLIMLASPGVCVNTASGKSSLYIHWVGPRQENAQKAAQRAVDKFENLLKTIFE